MKIDWCWACRHEHPMLDDHEFAAVWQAYQDALRHGEPVYPSEGLTPREALLKLQESDDHPQASAAANTRQRLYRPLQDAYERVTGLSFEGGDPKVILHYRTSFYGPPCPHCGRLLRNPRARQCFECGTDWHDPHNVVRHRKG